MLVAAVLQLWSISVQTRQRRDFQLTVLPFMCLACRPTTALLTVGRERAQAAQVRAVGRFLRRPGQGKEVNALGRRSQGQMRKKSSQGASFEAIGKINQGSVLGVGRKDQRRRLSGRRVWRERETPGGPDIALALVWVELNPHKERASSPHCLGT